MIKWLCVAAACLGGLHFGFIGGLVGSALAYGIFTALQKCQA
jgi:hypothetical protein